MGDRSSVVRGVIARAVVGALTGAVLASPVGAAGTVTKKKARNIATKVFNENIASATVANANALDGRDSSAFLTTEQVLWARVAANGDLLDGAGATDANHLGGQGAYDVIFDRDVSECGYAATASSTNIAHEIAAEPRTGNANAVFVTTSFDEETADNSPFYLIVTCI